MLMVIEATGVILVLFRGVATGFAEHKGFGWQRSVCVLQTPVPASCCRCTSANICKELLEDAWPGPHLDSHCFWALWDLAGIDSSRSKQNIGLFQWKIGEK